MGKILLSVFLWASTSAWAGVVNAIYNYATDVPVAANGYVAAGNMINFSLNFPPNTGTDLMVINNTGQNFIAGAFDNLTNGQPVALSYGGNDYTFVANYYGGSGNDLVLVWASDRISAWGYNNHGQIGDGSSGTNRLLPVQVTNNGVLVGKTVVAVSASAKQSLALCSDDTVAAWGGVTNLSMLGNDTTNTSPLPVKVSNDANSALHGKSVVSIATSIYHSLALCSDGTLAAWGLNDNGSVGDNSLINRSLPVAVNTTSGSALNGKTIISIAAGDDGDSRYSSLALCSDGTVAQWGWLNHNVSLPQAVSAGAASALYGKTVVAISAGGYHNLALCSDGTVVAWGTATGNNVFGQLGNNSTADSFLPVAVNTNASSALHGKKVLAIAAGSFHSLALCSDGTLVSWGYNAFGQLGDNSKINRLIPVVVNTNSGVSSLYGKTVTEIAAGLNHSAALCSDGTLAEWGRNNFGQLGIGTTNNSLTATNVNPGVLVESEHFVHLNRGSASGEHGLTLIAGPAVSTIIPIYPAKLPNGAFQFSFTNTSGAFFSVLTTTNVALPLPGWTAISGVIELSPGHFQFTDPQATNGSQRFYSVRSP